MRVLFCQSVSFLIILLGLGCVPTPMPTADHTLAVVAPPAVFKGKIMQSDDQGQTWRDISHGLPTDQRITAATVANGQLMVGYDQANLYTRSKAEPHPWIKSGLNFLTYGIGLPDEQRTLTGFYPTASAVYTYVIRDGLYKKPHGTGAWQALGAPKGLFSVNDIREDAAGNVYLATHNGLYFSADGGHSWELRSHFGWVLDLQLQGATLIASGQGGVYRSDDQGQHWQAMPVPKVTDLASLTLDDFAYDLEPTPQGIIAIRSRTRSDKGVAGKVQLSTDGGHTWRLHPADAHLKNLEDITSVVVHQGRIYCSYQGGVICSADQGRTWTPLLQYDACDAGTTLQLSVTDEVLYCLEVAMGC